MKSTLLFIIPFFSIFCTSQTIGLSPFATGFTAPLEITHPAGDARLFVVQQGGAIRILNPNQTINSPNFLTLTTATISTGSERGLLGLAFHPNYATNGYFYINYTNTAGNTVISRYSVSANPNVANPTGTILMTIQQPFANHNGGTLRFGPDGYLYIGMGDGGSGGDPGNRAQNINENLGKMLRIDVNSGSPYGIPTNNPYVGVAGNDEIWAIGLRNPWKFSFNRLNNDLWIADVGQDAHEEINKVSSTAAGLNYGWHCYEATSVYTSGCALLGTTYTFPVAEYTHSGGACSITGGYVYTGSMYPNLTNKYLFADYCSNKIGMIDATTPGPITWTTAFAGSNFTTFGEDMTGQLYIAGGSSGVIYKIIDTSLSVSTFNKSGFNLYPNPATSEVFIKSSDLQFPAAVTVSDMTGKTLLNQSLNSESTAIAVSSLSSGVYLVHVKDRTGANFSSKLTVK